MEREKVQNMQYMFNHASADSRAICEKWTWDVSSVTTAYGCSIPPTF